MKERTARLQIFIEELRKELVQLGSRKPLIDPEVLKLSQKLDNLLNEYEYQKMQL